MALLLLNFSKRFSNGEMGFCFVPLVLNSVSFTCKVDTPLLYAIEYFSSSFFNFYKVEDVPSVEFYKSRFLFIFCNPVSRSVSGFESPQSTLLILLPQKRLYRATKRGFFSFRLSLSRFAPPHSRCSWTRPFFRCSLSFPPVTTVFRL